MRGWRRHMHAELKRQKLLHAREGMRKRECKESGRRVGLGLRGTTQEARGGGGLRIDDGAAAAVVGVRRRGESTSL